jgi:hypothetical protein
MSAITISLGRTVAASSAGATRSTRGRTAAKKSAVEVSKRNAPVCRVVQDPAASMDVGSSIDIDMDMRRRIVQMDTATTLRKTIDVRAPPPHPVPVSIVPGSTFRGNFIHLADSALTSPLSSIHRPWEVP